MLNKTLWLKLSMVSVAALFMVIALSCESIPPPKWGGIRYTGEDIPFLVNTSIKFTI